MDGPESIVNTTETVLDLMLAKPLYEIEEARKLLSLGRSKFYELLADRRIRSVKEGRRRLVPATAIVEYVQLLEREAETALEAA